MAVAASRPGETSTGATGTDATSTGETEVGETAAGARVEQEVTEVRATGRTPESVTAEVQEILRTRADAYWELFHVQPIIYNSSTTGYLLLFFKRAARAALPRVGPPLRRL